MCGDDLQEHKPLLQLHCHTVASMFWRSTPDKTRYDLNTTTERQRVVLTIRPHLRNSIKPGRTVVSLGKS